MPEYPKLASVLSPGAQSKHKIPVPRWNARLTREHLRVLWGSFLGWMFDGYEQYAIVIALPSVLRTLLRPDQAQHSSVYFGLILCFTLLGWGIGGLAGGILTDYLGRKRMMMASVLAYAIFSGFSGLSRSFESFAFFRLITGLALGSEWSTGVTLVAETWPDEARAKGCGILQAAIGLGMLVAVGIWYSLSLLHPTGIQNWRILFLVGALPAFLVLYLLRRLDESERWITAVKERHWEAIEGQTSTTSRGRRPFTLAAIWHVGESRSRLLLTSLLSFITVIGWWAVSTLLPGFTDHLATVYNAGDHWGSRAAMIYLLGATISYLLSGFIIDWIGRRRYLWMAYAGSVLLIPLTYLWSGKLLPFMGIVLLNGFFTQGCAYAWMAIYVGELFTSTVRSTACSFVFNSPRLIAAFFPIMAGLMIQHFGGAVQTALILGSFYIVGLLIPYFLPETNGKVLPT